ncbi:putative calcium-binding protein CML36 [Rosa sericea]
MKLMKINSLSPKRLFGSKKDRSAVSRSDPPSFGSGTASSSSSDPLPSDHKPGPGGMGTPTSVLPGKISGDWSDFSADTHLDVAQAFKLIDRDNDGLVSRKELEALLKRLGAEPPSQEEVAMMLSEVDRVGDGCIPLEALLHRFGPACEPAANSELREAFEVFDTDHDGKISAEELFSVFTVIGDDRCTLEDCRRMIAEVDKNGDGFVCFQDFALMMELQR